ncbi:hypothetical protein BEL01nite_81280 [Bradyrhizobium elkanii]|nr:hypothetical protein BEL01nite_81280 [Bradyrhizobium elkanii]
MVENSVYGGAYVYGRIAATGYGVHGAGAKIRRKVALARQNPKIPPGLHPNQQSLFSSTT